MKRMVFSIGCLALVVVMMLTYSAQAQTGGAESEPAAPNDTYFDYFVVNGGPIAWGLIALLMATIALAIEHCFSIRRATFVPSEAASQVQTLVDQKEYLEAIRFTAEDPSMIGYVLNAGLIEAANGFTAMERALQDSIDDRSARLFRKIEYLNMIGSVAPMIGLLGTVTGMILLFADIHAADAFPGARVVAGRIFIALITTFWGLVVAIPALSIYAAFRNRIDVLTAETALTAERILAVFKPGHALAAQASPAGDRVASEEPSAPASPTGTS